jgi:hypothetical protein
MTTPADARGKLDALARELGDLAWKLADVERVLEPVEAEYTKFVDDFETGLWFQHVSEEGAKLPPAAMRLKLAQRAMDPELLGRSVALTNSRKRLQERIRSLKAEIEAQRSILSALKVELEATQ